MTFLRTDCEDCATVSNSTRRGARGPPDTVAYSFRIIAVGPGVRGDRDSRYAREARCMTVTGAHARNEDEPPAVAIAGPFYT